jgi:hypothetical protein
LLLIKRLLDAGHRPERVGALPKEDLHTQAEHSADSRAPSPHHDNRVLHRAGGVALTTHDLHEGRDGHPGRAACPEHHTTPATPPPDVTQAPGSRKFANTHDVASLRRMLSQALGHPGLSRFTAEVVVPLQRCSMPGARVLSNMASLSAAVRHWRAAQNQHAHRAGCPHEHMSGRCAPSQDCQAVDTENVTKVG